MNEMVRKIIEEHEERTRLIKQKYHLQREREGHINWLNRQLKKEEREREREKYEKDRKKKSCKSTKRKK